MQLCGVCSEQVPKYRCPACRIRYCSVSFFKRHKDDDSCHPVKETAAPVSTPTPRSTDNGIFNTISNVWEQMCSFTVSHVNSGESEALKALLWNPHLRQEMMSVDSAEDKAKAVKNAMQEPLFVEFTDQCLKMIEPAQMEEEDDEDDDNE
ncbi:zinc finger HIT domain-containing protein 3-like [Myxocyprinus asiaticus]|uniref:zinc finger HIT domain-containing protein 3-like n=1 Tax=Myxocyprinus asiaticus TaxID=70543 RepID=UPI002222C571|nr:zinc finger HIT domain-containing protein 3-like [Myxocyprinus asiaticus]